MSAIRGRLKSVRLHRQVRLRSLAKCRRCVLAGETAERSKQECRGDLWKQGPTRHRRARRLFSRPTPIRDDAIGHGNFELVDRRLGHFCARQSQLIQGFDLLNLFHAVVTDIDVEEH